MRAWEVGPAGARVHRLTSWQSALSSTDSDAELATAPTRNASGATSGMFCATWSSAWPASTVEWAACDATASRTEDPLLAPASSGLPDPREGATAV